MPGLKKSLSEQYQEVGDGWEELSRYLELACCDCSLVHDIEFRVRVKAGKPALEWKVFRNDKATKALRQALRRKRKRGIPK